MKQILLISDTPRVKQVFEALEAQEFLQLHTAVTLNQAEQEIGLVAPEFTFVQSRISGFSREIILRHLKKVLPDGATVVLLAGSFEEMEQAFLQDEPYLDMALDDEALTGAILQVLAGTYQAQKPVPSGPAPQEPEAASESVAEGASGLQQPPEPVAAVEPPPEASAAPEPPPEADEPSPLAEEQPAVAPEPLLQDRFVAQFEAFAAAQPVELPTANRARLQSFADHMDQAAQKDEPQTGSVQIEERIVLGPRHHAAQEDASVGPHGERAGRPASADSDILIGEPLADALRRVKKQKKPLWIPAALVLAVICVPVFSYLAGKKVAPPESALAPHSTATAQKHKQTQPLPATGATPPAPTAAEPARPQAADAAPTPATSPSPAVPATAPAAPSATAKAAPQSATPATPQEAPAGQRQLPALMAKTKADPEYGKSHPGWQRYLGTSMEYKVFRQGDLFKALQVLTLHGEDVPDPLFKRALREFGGSDAYQIRSTGEKGKYLVEQGEAKGGVAVTMYRSKADRRLKAFVLYYR